MKRKFKTASKIVIILTVAALCLSGCAEEGFVPKEETASSQESLQESLQESIPEIVETESTVQDGTEEATENVALEFDVQKALEEAESQASALQKKLQEDAFLTQTDMNTLSYEIYEVWDDVLNELWDELKLTLDKESMDSLLEEQRAWITRKEEEVKLAAEDVSGGSLAPLLANQKAAELTRTRVYELASFLE